MKIVRNIEHPTWSS